MSRSKDECLRANITESHFARNPWRPLFKGIDLKTNDKKAIGTKSRVRLPFLN